MCSGSLLNTISPRYNTVFIACRFWIGKTNASVCCVKLWQGFGNLSQFFNMI